jgi:hypothetical protein
VTSCLVRMMLSKACQARGVLSQPCARACTHVAAGAPGAASWCNTLPVVLIDRPLQELLAKEMVVQIDGQSASAHIRAAQLVLCTRSNSTAGRTVHLRLGAGDEQHKLVILCMKVSCIVTWHVVPQLYMEPHCGPVAYCAPRQCVHTCRHRDAGWDARGTPACRQCTAVALPHCAPSTSKLCHCLTALYAAVLGQTMWPYSCCCAAGGLSGTSTAAAAAAGTATVGA